MLSLKKALKHGLPYGWRLDEFRKDSTEKLTDHKKRWSVQVCPTARHLVASSYEVSGGAHSN